MFDDGEHAIDRRRKCAHEGCSTKPCFGVMGSTTAKFCARHSETGMVDVMNRTCVVEGCFKQPHYGVPGSKTGKFCALHSADGTADVTTKPCAHDGCSTQPFFGVWGTKRAEYCVRHKKRDMVNIWAKMCSQGGCTKTASFGVEGTTIREFCATHKKLLMVNLLRRMCSHPTCHSTAAFSTPGRSAADFCEIHAAAGMVDVRRSRCAYPDCRKLGKRGQDGKSKAFCPFHTNSRAGAVSASAAVLEAAAAAATVEAARKNPDDRSNHGKPSATAVASAPIASSRVTRLSATDSAITSSRVTRLSATGSAITSSRVTRLSATGSGDGIAKRVCCVAPRQRPPPQPLAVTGIGSSSQAARSVGERGLTTVSAPEGGKLWASLLSAEHELGTAASFKEVSRRACEDSDTSSVFRCVGEIHSDYDSKTDGWCEKCESVFRSTMKNKQCRRSKEVWLAIQLSRLRRGYVVGAWEVLLLSVDYLSRDDYVFVVSRFALHNFKFVSEKRGREIYECLVQAYPERLELWKGFIAAETETGHIQRVRNLFERLTKELDLMMTEQAREVFNMYVSFEKDHGDNVTRIEAVKARARKSLTMTKKRLLPSD